jgi:hypothetical protein
MHINWKEHFAKFLWGPIDGYPGKVKNEKYYRKMEQRALKNVNYCLNANIYTYFETSGGQKSNLYFNVGKFLNTSID